MILDLFSKEIGFENIHGYDDLKDIVRRALDAEDNYNGNDTSTQIQHWATNIDVTNLHGIFHTLGIPVSGGLGLGFLAGFVRTR